MVISRFSLFFVLIFGSNQITNAQERNFSPDFTTPKKTYETYLRAILAEDQKTAFDCHYFPREQADKVLDVVVGIWVMAYKLNNGAHTKFGPRGFAILREWHEGIFRSDCSKEAIERTLERVKAGKVEIKNGVAILTVRWAKDEPHPKEVFNYSTHGKLAYFRKINGNWKIDIQTETGFNKASDFFQKGSLGFLIRDLLAIERAVLSDLQGGKLRSEEEVIVALEKQMEVKFEYHVPGLGKQIALERAVASIKVPTVTYLPTCKYWTNSTHVPSVAVSKGGTIYAFWLAKGDENAPNGSPLPFLPVELNFSKSPSPEWSIVPGIHVYKKGKWSKAGLLLSGLHSASVAHAWCEGENLHLLVVDEEKEKTHHLMFDPVTNNWIRKFEFPYRLSSSYTAFRVLGKTVHVAFCKDDAFWYLRYDGEKWAKALRLDPGGNVFGGRMVHLAVTDEGVANVAWCARTEPGGYGHRHAVVDNGKITYRSLDFKDSPIAEANFDIGIDHKGRLMIAYMPKLPVKHHNANKIHIRYHGAKGWTSATLIDGNGESLVDEIIITGNKRRTLVSWTQGESYPFKGGLLGGAFRRMAITDGKTWTSARWIARTPNLRGNGTPVRGSHLSVCVDQKGEVHMVWGCCSYCLVANLNSP